MLSPSAPPFRRRRAEGLKRPALPRPPAAPLILLSAYYDGDAPGIHLVFDRSIDVSGLILSAFTVMDGPDFIHFVGTGVPFLVGPTEVLVFLHNIGSASGDDVLLTALAANGIVAVDDGGTWEGVSGAVLPIGE